MIKQHIYRQDQLPGYLRCQILAFLRIYYPEGFTGPNRLLDWISSPDDHPISILLVEKKILISHTQVVWKELEHGGVTYKAYGLTGVFTYPAFQGQGYGRQIVELGTAYIEASDGDIGIFHCAPRLEAFYTHSGWTAMTQSTTYIGTKAEPIIYCGCDENRSFPQPVRQEVNSGFHTEQRIVMKSG